MRRLVLLLALLASLLVVACGDDGEEPTAARGDAAELLRKAFKAQMPSGRLALDADVQIDGPDGEDESYALEVSGPFISHGPDRLPSVDLDVSFSGFGPALSGGFVLTEDNAFVTFGGESYEIGEELIRELNRQSREAADGRTSLEDFGIDASRWLRDPEVTGEEDVAGTATTKVSGEVDAARVLEDVAKLDEAYTSESGDPLGLDDETRQKLARSVEESRADVYVADDGTLRRVVLDLEFQVPEDLREDADGLEGGSVALDLTFSDVGEEQRITPPRDAKPIDELLGRFGLGQETLQ